MKKAFLGLLLTTVGLFFVFCNRFNVLELDYQDSNHLEETVDKDTNTFEKNRNSNNKFVDQIDEKINKNYAWVVYKLWQAE